MGALLETKCGMYEPNDVGKENTIKITCIVQKSPRDHEKIISTLRYKIFRPLKSKLCNNNQNFIKFQYNVCLMYKEIMYCNTYTKTFSKFFFNSKFALNEWLRNKIVPLIIF